MRIVTRTEVCQKVPAQWQHQYAGDQYLPEHAAKIAPLLALTPEDRTPEKINAIIGNDRWTRNACDECGTDCESLIRFGCEPDYDMRWQDLCADCLRNALQLLETPTPPAGTEVA